MDWRKFLKPTTIFFAAALIAGCSKDDELEDGDTSSAEYATQVYLTDAPVDNPDVKAVFVTITGVEVNGKSLEGFQKTTIDVSALTNGKTGLLGEMELEAGATSSIVLTFDHATDAAGNSPGSYVFTTEGEKKALATASSAITLNDQAQIFPSDDNKLILDFDLRKTVTADAEGAYRFASASQMATGIRAVNALNSGTISGTVSNMDSFEGEALVAFAYEKGSYEDSETEPDGDGVRFSNAVSSAIVDNSGNFRIDFLEEGAYEVRLVSFEDEDNDQKLEFKGELEINTLTSIGLQDIQVNSESTTSVELEIVGIFGL